MSGKKQNRSSANNVNVNPKSVNSPAPLSSTVSSAVLSSSSSPASSVSFQAIFRPSDSSAAAASHGGKGISNSIETQYILLSPLDLVALSLVPEDYAVIQSTVPSSSPSFSVPASPSLLPSSPSSSFTATDVSLPIHDVPSSPPLTPRPLYVGKVWGSKKQDKGIVTVPSMNVFFSELSSSTSTSTTATESFVSSSSASMVTTTTPRKSSVVSPQPNRSKAVSPLLQRTPSSSSSSSTTSTSSLLSSLPSYPVNVQSFHSVRQTVPLQPAERINVRKVYHTSTTDHPESLVYVSLHPTVLNTFRSLLNGVVLPQDGSILRIHGMEIEFLPVILNNNDKRINDSDSTDIHSEGLTLSYVYIVPETQFISIPHTGPSPSVYRSKKELIHPLTGTEENLSSSSSSLPPSLAPSGILLPTTTTDALSIPPATAIGGLDEPLHKLRELITNALHYPELYTQFALRPPKGALLVGPPGTGKTSIARDLAHQLNLPLFVINGAEILSYYVGESEAQLRTIFRKAALASPALIFLDEVDSLCPAREGSGNTLNTTNEVETRMVATLLALMDGVSIVPNDTPKNSSNKNGKNAVPSMNFPRIFIVGATNRASALDPAIRRPGRFDTEIYIGIPTSAQRCLILSACLRRYPHRITDTELNALANTLHGYVGADIAALCREAALLSLRRQVTDYGKQRHTKKETGPTNEEMDALSSTMEDLRIISPSSAVVPSPLPSGSPLPLSPISPAPSPPSFTPLTIDDLRTATRHVQPSALREITIEVPHVLWSDIGGQDEAKQRLREAVEWPLRHADAFTRMGIRPPRGALLYGPPGCSKTLLAKAMATESKLNFIAIKGPELFSKYVGDSEKAVAEVFNRARAVAPCIVFFDEFDALAPARGSDDNNGDNDSGPNVNTRVVAQLLQELDGIATLRQVVIVAATNRPDLIDPALLRPGRIDRRVYVGLPDEAARRSIIRMQLARITHACTEDEQGIMVKEFQGYTGAEIVGIFREAAVQCVREAMLTIGQGDDGGGAEKPTLRLVKKHIDTAKELTPKQVTQSMLKFYQAFGEAHT